MARIYEAVEGVLLPLGRRGENEALEVRVNIKQWIADYGNGAFGGLAQRYGEDEPYPVTITVNGNYACWLVTDVDTAIEGYGKFELDYIVGGVLAKSVMWRTKVQPSVAEPGPVPDPYESWVEEVLEAGAAVQGAIPKVVSADAGNVPTLTADGSIDDSGIAIGDVALRNGTYIDMKVGTAQHVDIDGSISGNVPAFTADGDIEDSGIAADEVAVADGYYDGMTVGNAEQLVSTVFVNNKVPYTYRPAGGAADIGDREYDSIVGGTIGWNQQLDPNDMASSRTINSLVVTADQVNGHITIEGTADLDSSFPLYSDHNLVANHKFAIVGLAAGSATTFCYSLSGASVSPFYGDTIFSYTVKSNKMLKFDCRKDTEASISLYPQIFDLTLMFGPTIANYIYNLEQNNPGAGVAFFHKLFPKRYYGYNNGALLSVAALASHNTTGLNQWDEVWELGTINSANGANQASSTRIRSKNYNRCLPDTVYYFYGPSYTGTNRIAFYDENKDYLGVSNKGWAGLTNGQKFTTPPNAAYFRFYVDGTEYNKICISIFGGGEHVGEYEAYSSHSYPLDATLTLRGVPMLDVNNALYYDGDTYAPDGTVTRKYGIVDLGTMTWTYSEEVTQFVSTSLNGLMKAADKINLICAKYAFMGRGSSATVAAGPDKAIYSFNNSQGNTNIRIKDLDYNDAAAFTVAMSGVYLVYEIKTQTTESATSYQSPQIVGGAGTEEYVAPEQSGVAVPVGHDTNYNSNLRAKLEAAPVNPAEDGDYIVRHADGQNTYVPLMFPLDILPPAPTTDGTYTLQMTVTDGVAATEWVEQ